MTRSTDVVAALGKPGAGSAGKTLRLLQALAREGRAMTLAELSECTAIPKATAHRLCARLLELGFISRDIDERFLAIGPALRNLAFDVLNHGTLSRLRHQVLAELVVETGETCNLTTLDGVEVLYLDRVEAPHPWRLTLSVGVHVPLHCTASGKLFLSHLPASDRDALMAKLPLATLTPASITDVESLRREITLTGERGYGLDAEEFVIGLIAVAVPVFDGNGLLRAAVAMHCPTTHVSAEKSLTHLPALKRAAQRMSELL